MWSINDKIVKIIFNDMFELCATMRCRKLQSDNYFSALIFRSSVAFQPLASVVEAAVIN